MSNNILDFIFIFLPIILIVIAGLVGIWGISNALKARRMNVDKMNLRRDDARDQFDKTLQEATKYDKYK